uniref:MFS transporter n=1 Tax=Prevotella sp. TaxID=59823 RepID=UPI003FEF8BE3
MNIKSISSRLKGNPTMVEGTVYSMLIICGISHFLNDMIQSIIPSIYPIVKDKFDFSFAQIGIITLVFQMTSSILQPFTGLYADKHPRPYALSVGMCFTLAGLLLLAFAENYFLILLAVSVVGLGSSVFHPTASRVAQLASGGKKSLAQSIFQVGGNGGSAVGPLLAALVILPFGQHAIAWFALAALLAAIIMVRLGAWYKARLAYVVNHPQKQPLLNHDISKRAKYGALAILILLVFSKYFYTACITSYFTFFLIDKFGVSVQTSQLCLFVFLAAFAIGTVAGGMLGDRFGRKYVIWFSILGAAPFAIAMPFVGFAWTIVCTFLSGLIIASAFSSIVVYATDLMPDKVGLIAGVFFGLMFGLGGLGSAFFGWLADKTSVEFIFQVSAFLPLLGIIAGFLPNTQKTSKQIDLEKGKRM